MRAARAGRAPVVLQAGAGARLVLERVTFAATRAVSLGPLSVQLRGGQGRLVDPLLLDGAARRRLPAGHAASLLAAFRVPARELARSKMILKGQLGQTVKEAELGIGLDSVPPAPRG